MFEYSLRNAEHRMRYHDFPGKGLPLLFIHGLGCAGSFDYPQAAAQEALAGHRRILVDLLGSGFSDKPDDFPYSVAGHAKYLAEFVSDMGLKRFLLFGHSLGGAVALSLASRCRERLAGVVLSEANLDSGGGLVSRSIAAYGFDEFIRRGFGEIVRKNRDESNTMWAASFSLSLPAAVYRISQSAVAGETPSWREILYSLDCPRTFIFGERSLPDPDVQALAGHGIHIEIVKDAGHSMAWENPAGLAMAIRNGIDLTAV